ncbi:proteinrelated to cholinesterase [Metarhizium robertsii ARSEF 23]|nr:proteinrelated to cholinesterase [Metarhizium robertsii ARSEF 23]KHO11787.1 proteinrelated to cholinesterase [Metarhizium robertsii ARSEF 23]
MVGTITCENFCNSAASFTSAQGIVHNPHQPGYSAGGSGKTRPSWSCPRGHFCSASSASASCVGASAAYFRFLGLETAQLPWSNSNSRKLFPSTKNTLINGLYPSAKFPGLYRKTPNIGRQIRDAYQRVFDKYVVIMPTTPFVAPRHADWKRHGVLGSFEPTCTIWLTTNTAVFPVTGHQGISRRLSRPIHVYIVVTQPPLIAKTSKTFNILRDYRRIKCFALSLRIEPSSQFLLGFFPLRTIKTFDCPSACGLYEVSGGRRRYRWMNMPGSRTLTDATISKDDETLCFGGLKARLLPV